MENVAAVRMYARNVLSSAVPIPISMSARIHFHNILRGGERLPK